MGDMRYRRNPVQGIETPDAIAASTASQLQPGQEALIYPQKGLFASATARVVRRAKAIDFYFDDTSILREWLGTPDYTVEIKGKPHSPED